MSNFSEIVSKEIMNMFSKDRRIDPVVFESVLNRIDPNASSEIETEMRHSFSNNTGGDLRTMENTPSLFIKKELATNEPQWSEPVFEDYNEDVIGVCTYRKMSLDPQIALGMLLIKGFVSTLKYKVKSQDRKVEAVVDYVLSNKHNTLVKELIDTSFELGYAFCEKVWQNEKVRLEELDTEGNPSVVYSGYIMSLKKVKNLDTEQGFSFYKKAGVDEIDHVEQDQTTIGAYNVDNTKVVIPRHKLVWFALDQKYSDIFGRSRYKMAYESWFFTRKIHNLMLAHLKRTGSPPSFVRFPNGDTEIDGRRVNNNIVAQRILAKLDGQASIAIPSMTYPNSEVPLWEAGFLEIKNSDPSPYLKVLEFFYRQKIAALGIPDALLVGDAAYSSLDALTDLLMIMIEDLVEQIENTIRRDLVDYIVEYNFGPEALTSFTYEIDRTGLGRTKLLKDIIVNMIRFNGGQGDLKPTITADLSKVFEEMNIPVASYESLFKVPDELKDWRKELEKMKASSKPQGRNPLKEAAQQEDTNGANRVNKTDRSDEGRRTNKENIAE